MYIYIVCYKVKSSGHVHLARCRRLSGSIVKDRVGAAITLFSAVIALLVQDDPSLPAM